jgi:hypothetical protein
MATAATTHSTQATTSRPTLFLAFELGGNLWKRGFTTGAAPTGTADACGRCPGPPRGDRACQATLGPPSGRAGDQLLRGGPGWIVAPSFLRSPGREEPWGGFGAY